MIAVVHPRVMFGAAQPGVCWQRGSLVDANRLLAVAHYLGPIGRGLFAFVGLLGDAVVACQVWSKPTSRRLPSDGSWLELSRWCLTSDAGENAGSRMHAWSSRWLSANAPEVTTLVSYSDPSQGHTGVLYRACNWEWAPTWHRLRPPPSGLGSWDGVTRQAVKDRWIFMLRPDADRASILRVDDPPAVRGFVPTEPYQRRWLVGVTT